MKNCYDNKSFNEFMNQDFGFLANWINTLNAYEFVSIATLIGMAIAPTLSINQQNSLGNFFEQLGQTILTISAQSQTVKHKMKQKSPVSKNNITDVESEIDKIKDELIQLRKDALMNDNI